MTTTIGGVVIDIDARLSRLETSLAKATSDLNRFQRDAKASATAIERHVSSISSSFSLLKGALAGGVAIEFAKMAGRSLDFAAGLGEVSQQLGVTTKDYQTYRYIASQVGVDQETMNASLAKLTQNLGKAALGGKAQAGAFDAIGVSVRNADGSIKTAGQTIPEIAEKLSHISDPAKRAALEVALFGKSGQQLDPLLMQGAKGLQEFTARALQLGIVLDDKLIDAADAAADKMSEVKLVLEANISSAVAQNANAILGLASALSQLTVAGADFAGKHPQIASALAGLAVGTKFGPGAMIAGTAIGLAFGENVKREGDLANNDLAFRKKALQSAIDNVKAQQQLERLNGNWKVPRQFVGAHGPLLAAEQQLKLQTDATERAALAARIAKMKSAGSGSTDVASFLGSDAGGGVKGAKVADTFTSAFARLQERTADLSLELQALNEQWPDFQLDEAKVRADAFATALKDGATWTQAQRDQWANATDDLAQMTRAMDFAQERNREMGDAFRQTQADLEKMVGKLSDSINIEPQLEKISAALGKRLPDLRSQWDKLLDGFGQKGEYAFQAVAQGIDDLVVHFDSLGDVVRGIVQQLASMALSSFVIAPLGKALGIPAHAAGTDFAPGGWSLVGERGPEIVNLPRGSQVIPNHRLRGAVPAMQGIEPGSMTGGNVIHIHVGPGGTERQRRETAQQVAFATRRALADMAKFG